MSLLLLQDGKSSSLTAPHGPSQQAVIQAALSDAQLLPAQVAGLEMHGTGTPLGDPIEVGAAAAVLTSLDRPLQLSAAKSLTGHAEPAAGMVGVVHAASMLRRVQCSILPQLRNVNPHITSLLTSGAKSEGSALLLPRQGAGRTAQPGHQSVGVSAFAFQGTNAHSILSPADPLPESESTKTAWQRSRYWYTTKQYSILQKASAIARSQLVFSCKLAQPAMAFFLDHRIQGAALFPGAGMFDMGLSAADCIAGEGSSLLVGVSIAQPLPMGGPHALVLSCSVDVVSGKTEVRSQAAPGGVKTHLSAWQGERPAFSPI